MNAYLKLTKEAAAHAVMYREMLPCPPVHSAELSIQRACYISIFENPGRRLRATAGSLHPRSPMIAQEIIMTTTAAILETPTTRWRRQDLSNLRYSVGVVGSLQRVYDTMHLDPNWYGLYLRADDGKCAVLLPRRAGIETPEDQVATAVRESGINTRHDAYALYKFEVVYYDE